MNAPLYPGASANIPSIHTFTSNPRDTYVGRFATRRWEKGDDIPAAGAMIFASGVHADVESDQHRAYKWMRVIGVTDPDENYVFICVQAKNCWPSVERMENMWIAEIVDPQ